MATKKRGMLGKIERLFTKPEKEPKGHADILSLFIPNFSDLAKPEFNATFMSAVNAHARHVSKIKPEVYLNDEPTKNKKYLNRILNLRPNPVMTAPQLWKIVATNYFRDNLAILYLEWDYDDFKEPLKNLWPLDFDKNSLEFRSYNGELTLRFRLEGEERYASAEDLILLVREADASNVLGSRSPAINETLRVIKTSYEGIEQAIKMSAFIRFIVNSTTPLKDEVKEQKAKKFAEDYLTAGKSHGVIYTDSASQVTKVESTGKYANADDMKYLKEDIYEYLGITSAVITGKYTEDEFQSYYETSIEPLLVEIESELTVKLFTQSEIEKGNNVRITSSRLQNASLNTRIKIAQLLMKMPIVKPNQITELLYLAKLENGDKEYAVLNYTQSDKQNEYQGVSDNETGSTEQNEEEGKEDKDNA